MNQTKPQLVITFDQSNGSVNVSGPIQDRVFCFGIMELAKDAINEHAREDSKQILIARPKVVGLE